MRALYRIQLQTNKPMLQHKGLGRAVVDKIRGAMIDVSKNSGVFDTAEMAMINHKPKDHREAPTILYGQPIFGINAFDLYGRGEEGLKIIEKLSDEVLKQRILSIGEEQVLALKKRPVVVEPFLVTREAVEKRYYFATPAILYDKTREHGEWLAISKKYRESDPDEYSRQMKRSIANLIKANIRYQMKYVVFKGMSNIDALLSYLDDLHIEIDRFHFKIDYYHRDGNQTPMLFAHFRTNFTMPRFIGHHSGRGYGLVQIDKRQQGASNPFRNRGGTQ